MNSKPILSICWWNILQKGNNPFKLNRNIQIICDYYDVIILGEYSENSLGSNAQNKLNSMFSYQFFTPYNDLGFGIKVFSKKPLNAIKTEYLSTIDNGFWSNNCHSVCGYDRNITLYKYLDIVIIPFHGMQPWTNLKNKFKNNFLSRLYVLLKILFSKNNPLYNQCLQLINLTYKYNDVVLLGDFNIFPKFIFTTKIYKMFKKQFKIGHTNNDPTWPVNNSEFKNSYASKLQLDHSFYKSDKYFITSQTLKLEGSDHYPINCIIFSKQK